MTGSKNKIAGLSSVARRAWRRLETEFPSLASNLDTRGGELEFAVPAPQGSAAGHLVVFSSKRELWVRFSHPHMCYLVDDEIGMTSVVKQLIADDVVFKVVMRGEEWVETTLTIPKPKCESKPGLTVRLVSWSGRFDQLLS